MGDKRRYLRFTLALPAELSSARARSFVPCRLTDISREGCKIDNIPSSFSAERELTVKTILPENTSVALHARVQWLAHKGRRACAGCFIQETEHGDKFRLLDHAYRNWRSQLPDHGSRKRKQTR